MAQAQAPSGRSKSSSPRHIQVIAVVTEDEEAQGVFKPMDLNHVIKLLEEKDKVTSKRVHPTRLKWLRPEDWLEQWFSH